MPAEQKKKEEPIVSHDDLLLAVHHLVNAAKRVVRYGNLLLKANKPVQKASLESRQELRDYMFAFQQQFRRKFNAPYKPSGRDWRALKTWRETFPEVGIPLFQEVIQATWDKPTKYIPGRMLSLHGFCEDWQVARGLALARGRQLPPEEEGERRKKKEVVEDYEDVQYEGASSPIQDKPQGVDSPVGPEDDSGTSDSGGNSSEIQGGRP